MFDMYKFWGESPYIMADIGTFTLGYTASVKQKTCNICARDLKFGVHMGLVTIIRIDHTNDHHLLYFENSRSKTSKNIPIFQMYLIRQLLYYYTEICFASSLIQYKTSDRPEF